MRCGRGTVGLSLGAQPQHTWAPVSSEMRRVVFKCTRRPFFPVTPRRVVWGGARCCPGAGTVSAASALGGDAALLPATRAGRASRRSLCVPSPSPGSLPPRQTRCRDHPWTDLCLCVLRTSRGCPQSGLRGPWALGPVLCSRRRCTRWLCPGAALRHHVSCARIAHAFIADQQGVASWWRTWSPCPFSTSPAAAWPP